MNLSIKFNLRPDVASDFVEDLPNERLEKLRSLLATYGAVIRSLGRIAGEGTQNSDLEKVTSALIEAFERNPDLRGSADANITVQLTDDRNVRSFLASIVNGDYGDVIDPASIEIDLQLLIENSEVQEIIDAGMVRPEFPPSYSCYKFK